MGIILQNNPFTKMFILVSSTDHTSPLLGAIPNVTISKNGQFFTAPQGAVIEVGDGWYSLTYTTVDTNTVGELSLHVTATGGDNTDLSDQVLANISVTTVAPPYINQNDLNNFVLWIRQIMGITTDNLPDDSPYIITAYLIANEIVNRYLNVVSPILYYQAIYNLAADILVNITQDVPPSTYWANMRTSLGTNSFIPGMINATNDEDTSAAILTPLGLQNITLGDLQNMKTPWGRMYLSIAQSIGTMWGLS
jgi:hypothetical protein